MKKKRIFSILKYMCAQSLYASNVLFFVEILISVLHAFCLTLMLVSQQRFFDCIADRAAGDNGVSLIESFIFMAVLLVCSEVLNGLDNYFPNIMTSRLRIRLRAQIQDKVNTLSLFEMENSDVLDEINKAEEGRYHAVCFFYLMKEVLTFYLPYFVFMSAYLFRTQSYIAFCILVLFIPVCCTHIIHLKLFAKAEEKKAPIRRRKDYFIECICGKEYYKETRVLDAYKYFYQKFGSELKELCNIDKSTQTKCSRIDFLLRAFSSICYCGTLIFSLYMLTEKKVTVGMFVALINGLSMIFAMIEEMVYERIGEIAKGFGNIDNYFGFLDRSVESDLYDQKAEISGSIKLEHVTFAYPNTAQKALEDICLTIRQGQSLAIVGENGSGKTTLSKIIMGMMTPQSGVIRYGKQDIEMLDRSFLYDRLSAVFQNFSRYKLSLRKNLTISSNIEKTDDELDILCRKVDFDINGKQFPDKLDTVLSSEFDGVELSGGEWQRIAICRALNRPYAYLFLDEPTSAIDPIEEMFLYHKFYELTKGVTSVIVTHRLGAARIADYIIVMKDGRIAEAGSNDELIEKKGEYYRLWEVQKGWYADN